eukprot:CAMPEP_0119507024 /NCGR_PEP_ID=MMETSP1344-20130328/27054_1 /TAXON_ID=236787 /ORGANISM="Florenciella parvula, Strain CCMP2471" /LENGTH=67 /DNA_ID=CAMNT_0007543617 /DNA_START=235 /DNA_END=435 /DNA_ORIENTATION=+
MRPGHGHLDRALLAVVASPDLPRAVDGRALALGVHVAKMLGGQLESRLVRLARGELKALERDESLER